MNKKGFTLIELVVVIILICAIILLVLPKITNSVNNYSDEIDEITYTLIKDATKLYITDNSSLFTKEEENVYCISLNELIENKYLKNKLEYNNKDITNIAAVKVTYDNGFNYEVVNKNSCTMKPEPKSFSEDSWQTIILNVKFGNSSVYNVGDTKQIYLDEFGAYTIRISNTSMPIECNGDGFSQTACGFVIEFTDIITTKPMNIMQTNEGGWKSSTMRAYVNTELFNLFPEILKENIIDTYVVSSREKGVTYDYETTEKIYLLSTKEISGTSDSYDTQTNTRQLDYYNAKTVDQLIKKYNGVITNWWLRSAISYNLRNFYVLKTDGTFSNINAANVHGVSPAFRIG